MPVFYVPQQTFLYGILLAWCSAGQRRHSGLVRHAPVDRRRPEEEIDALALASSQRDGCSTCAACARALGSSLVAIIGFAGVVAVFVAVLSIAEGFRKVMSSAGRQDTALVLRGGSDTEMSSGLLLDQTKVIKEGPGVLKATAGPIASAELFVIVDVPKRNTGTDANVPLRGVEREAFAVRGNIEIVEGGPSEGRNEVIVGQGAANQFAGLDVGNRLRWGENTWEVVGVFTAGGSVYESEIWADARVVQPAYRRGSTFQSVYAKLESPQAFQGFKDALTADPRLEVDVMRERDLLRSTVRVPARTGEILGNLIADLMAVGRTFGALNTMYTALPRDRARSPRCGPSASRAARWSSR